MGGALMVINPREGVYVDPRDGKRYAVKVLGEKPYGGMGTRLAPALGYLIQFSDGRRLIAAKEFVDLKNPRKNPESYPGFGRDARRYETLRKKLYYGVFPPTGAPRRRGDPFSPANKAYYDKLIAEMGEIAQRLGLSTVPRKHNIAVRKPRAKKTGILVHQPAPGAPMLATDTFDTGINLPPFMYVEATARKGKLMLIAHGAYNAMGLIGTEMGGVALVNVEAHDVVGTLAVPWNRARRMQILQDIYASKDWIASAERWGFGLRYRPNPGTHWHDKRVHTTFANMNEAEKLGSDPRQIAYAKGRFHEAMYADEAEHGSSRHPAGKRPMRMPNPLAVTYTDVGGGEHNIVFRDRREFERWQEREMVDPSGRKGGDVASFSLKRRFKASDVKRPWQKNPSRPVPTRREAERAQRTLDRATSPSLRRKMEGIVSDYRAFHFDTPDRAYKVQAPASFPRKLWMLGTLHKLMDRSGKVVLSGGILAAGAFGRAPLFILNAKSHGAPARFLAGQTEYVPQRASKLHGAVYYHEHSRRSPVTVTRVAPSYYKVAGGGLRITRRGIVG